MAIPAFKDMNKQQQLMILIGVPIVVALAFAYLSYQTLGKLGPDPILPKFMHRKVAGSKWVDINKTIDEIGKQQAIIDRKPAVEAELASLQGEINRNEERLPKEAEKAIMMEVIEKYAREIPSDLGTVRFKAVKINDQTAAGGGARGKAVGNDYQTITYATEILGDMNGIIKYIDSIEKNFRFMAVKSVSIKPGGITIDEPSIKIVYDLHEVSLDIVTYVYTPPAVPGKGK
jgi:hypothetical protein